MQLLRLRRINRHIQRTLGEIILAEADLPEGVLVTVVGVETAANLQSTTVRLSVLPAERGVSVLAALRTQLYRLQGSFNRQVRLQPRPRLLFTLESGITHAAHSRRHAVSGT